MKFPLVLTKLLEVSVNFDFTLSRHFFCKSFTFFETIKAGMHWHQTIKLYQHAYRNITDIFTCFPSIWQHIKALTLHKITFIAAGSWSRLGGPIQKAHAFTQPLNHKKLGFSSQNLKFHKSSLGPRF